MQKNETNILKNKHKIIDSTPMTFVKDVIEASNANPIILYLWSQKSSICNKVGINLEQNVQNPKYTINLVKINILKYPKLAHQLQIQSVPTIMIFFKKNPVKKIIGPITNDKIIALLDELQKLTLSPHENMLNNAQAAFNKEDVGTAINIYNSILQEDPKNNKAIIGLSKSYLINGDVEKSKSFLYSIKKQNLQLTEFIALDYVLKLYEEKIQNPDEYQKQLQTNPREHQYRFYLAMSLFINGQKLEAIKELLEIIKQDLQWKNQAARKFIVAIFEILGNKNPITLENRKKLSTLLFK